MESGKLELESEPFDLRHCLWDVIDLFAAKAAEKNLELICSVEECVPSPIVGDAMRLRQVIVNLVSNALKFTEKGEVAIEVTMAPLGSSERQPDASSEPGGLRLLFSIRDTGIGVAPNKLDRLFQSFSQVASTTARQYGGTGLGLAICRGLIERMGGTIRADSVEGQGTTFRFSLPFGVAATGAWRLSPPQLAGRRVLIVDDHPGSRRNLAEQVSQWSMVAVACEHGDEALARVRAEEKFDVVILDWRLPGIPGEELAMALRALPAGSRLPIVFLTPIGTRIENEKLLAESYVNLRKPSRPAALQRALRRLVGGEITSPSPTRVEPVTPPSQSPLATRYPVKILLADDNVINQKVAVRLLQQIGYQATVVADGREVLAALEAAPFDLVFMDVQMPELDGLEATRRIRQRQADPSSPANFRRRIRIVAMTANVVQGDREKCLGAGMDEYLPKPVRPAALAEMVERFGAELAEPISAPGPTPVANPGTERFTPFPVSSAANSSPETVNELPVDLDRLMEFAGSDNGMWNELVSLYLTQTGDQLRQLRQALEDSDASRVVRIAHSCAGASGTCGMVSMHSRLRELEQRAKGGDLSSARGLFAPVSETLHLTKEFLKVQPNITPPTRELCSL